MGYTLQQLQQMGATPVPQPQPTTTGGGYTYDQLIQMGAKPVQKPGIVSLVANGVSNAVTQGVADIKGTLQKNAQDQKAAPSLGGEIATGADLAGKLTALPFQAIGGALGAVIPQGVKNAAANGLQSAANAVTNTPASVDALNKVNDLIDKHPHVAQFLGGLFNTAMNVGGADTGTGAAKDVVSGVATKASDASTELASKIGGANGAQRAVDAVKNKVYQELPGLNPDKEAALKTVASDWRAPIDSNTAGFKKATKIIEKNPEIPQFLAEQGLSPYKFLEDGKYATADAADTLREEAGNMSRDMLRPSLKVADYSIPKTSVIEIRDAAIANVRNNREITPGNKDAIIQQIKREAVALQKENPEGLSLVAMHDNKITYAQNGGYSPVNDPQVNNTATANRSLSSSMGKEVERKAPADVPVDTFNKELSKYYKSADYLNELSTKRAPVSQVTKIVRGAAKMTGAVIGAHTGGVLSEVIGYQIAGRIEKMLEGFTVRHRAMFLDNLARENPKVFQQVQDYLNTNRYGSAVPRLPAPSAVITPAPSEQDQMAGRARQILNQ